MSDKPPLNDSMILYAVRYCLGRRSYAVLECVNYLTAFWPHIGRETEGVILRDVREALERGAVGMRMDEERWRKVLELAS